MKKEVDVEKFVSFHRGRVSLLKDFRDKKIQGRLIFQISFLGFESLARLLYQNEKSPGKRFIKLLSIKIGENEASELYTFWRNSLIHQGFIADPWTTLEGWDEDDVAFLSFPLGLKSSVEYPPGSIIAIYENLIDYFEDYFKKAGIKKIELLN
jgi:hypothetical protein